MCDSLSVLNNFKCWYSQLHSCPHLHFMQILFYNIRGIKSQFIAVMTCGGDSFCPSRGTLAVTVSWRVCVCSSHHKCDVTLISRKMLQMLHHLSCFQLEIDQLIDKHLLLSIGCGRSHCRHLFLFPDCCCTTFEMLWITSHALVQVSLWHLICEWHCYLRTLGCFIQSFKLFQTVCAVCLHPHLKNCSSSKCWHSSTLQKAFCHQYGP